MLSTLNVSHYDPSQPLLQNMKLGSKSKAEIETLVHFESPKSLMTKSLPNLKSVSLQIPAPINQNSEVASMLSNVAKTAPKSLDLIIDTPDFYDFANVDKTLILPHSNLQHLSALEADQTIEPADHGLGRVYSRDDLTMRAKQLSISKGFKL